MISRARHPGARPESRRAAATLAARSLRSRWVGGQVHVQEQGTGLGGPAGHLAAGLAQDEPVELDHQAGLLGQGMNSAGGDQAAVGRGQRTGASAPAMRPLWRSTIGW